MTTSQARNASPALAIWTMGPARWAITGPLIGPRLVHTPSDPSGSQRRPAVHQSRRSPGDRDNIPLCLTVLPGLTDDRVGVVLAAVMDGTRTMRARAAWRSRTAWEGERVFWVGGPN